VTDRVRVAVSITARAEAAHEIEAIVRELCAQSRKEVGCMRYDVLQQDCLVLYAEWTSNAHLDVPNKTPQPLLVKPP
jgi:quinol monooxygenase YgiN